MGAASGAVQHHQQEKYAAKDQAAAADQAAYQSLAEQEQTQAQMAEMQQQMAAMQAQQAQAAIAAQAPAPAPSAPAGNDIAAQINRVAQLRDSGVLSDEEFAAAKAKILATV